MHHPWTLSAGPADLPSGAVLTEPESGMGAIATAFAAAAEQCPARLRRFDCRFADRPVRIRTVGLALGEVVEQAVAHLLTAAPARGPRPEGETSRDNEPRAEARGSAADIPADQARPRPALTIDLWDGAETGVPWRMAAERGGLGVDYWFARSADQRYVAQERPHELTWLDRSAGRIVGWITDATALNMWERARVAYFPVLLWLHDQGLVAVHAALVGCNGRGVLLAGEAGRGKSTAAVNCLLGGLDFLGDDHAWIERAGDGLAGYGLYATTHLLPEALARYPRLLPFAQPPAPPAEPKSLVYLRAACPERIASRCRIAAVALPRLAASPGSGLRPTGRAEALMSLVAGSILEYSFQRMPNPADRFAVLADLVEAVPCYRLDVGADPADVPRAVRRMLEGTT